MINSVSLEPNENIIFKLRSIYDMYGYSHYKMSKFEEYDLYSKNKDFLVSDGVITFTDTNGKLMALKPDVTLSIIKNTLNSSAPVQKLYYNENVYRVSKSTHSFKEIMQVGLECIGNVDGLCVLEVLTLAAESLKGISDSRLLDISNLDLLVQTLDYAGVPKAGRAEIFHFIGEKNLHQLASKCRDIGISDENIQLIKGLAAVCGSPEKVLPQLRELLSGKVDENSLAEFEKTVTALPEKSCVNIDFSLVDNVSYYSGIVFKGFIEGIPAAVLSGGQYDTLMKKMNRKSGAIGFAVYLDMLDRYKNEPKKYDVDTVLVYDGETLPSQVMAQAEKLRKEGSVLSAESMPQDIRCRRTVFMKKGEVYTVENHA